MDLKELKNKFSKTWENGLTKLSSNEDTLGFLNSTSSFFNSASTKTNEINKNCLASYSSIFGSL